MEMYILIAIFFRVPSYIERSYLCINIIETFYLTAKRL